MAAGLFGEVTCASEELPAGSDSRVALSNPNWITTGPAVYAILKHPATNTTLSVPPSTPPNREPEFNHLSTQTQFDHYLPQSLNNLVWTNFIAHTNGRNVAVWSVRSHPPGWPHAPPLVSWNTNSLAWGLKGATAISPCWEDEGSSGQVPITALTKRHGYTRGHGMGPDGFGTNRLGKKIWFVTTQNALIEMTVLREVVRTIPGSGRDYSILLFSDDLPAGIQPIRAVAATNLLAKYLACPGAPRPIFKTEQGGNLSAEVPGFWVSSWKGGDSGSPDMLPLPGELVFFGGRSTSGPSARMQWDMDELCRLGRLDPKKYQLQWLDLSGYPSY